MTESGNGYSAVFGGGLVKAIIFVMVTLVGTASWARPSRQFEFLQQKTIKLKTNTLNENIETAMLDTLGVLSHYRPKFDSTVKLLSPLKVYGHSKRPRIWTRVRKCVIMFCETVNLEAKVQMKSFKGHCDKSWRIDLDLRKSSRRISDIYDHLKIKVCLRHKKNGISELRLVGKIHQGKKYKKGFARNLIFDLLKQQVAPLSKALFKNLKSYGIGVLRK